MTNKESEKDIERFKALLDSAFDLYIGIVTEYTDDGPMEAKVWFLLPDEVLEAATKGFMAGIYGPKHYEANSWLKLDSETMIKERIAAMRRHLNEVENDQTDPDTGLANNEIFLLTNAIMIAYHRMKLRGEIE